MRLNFVIHLAASFCVFLKNIYILGHFIDFTEDRLEFSDHTEGLIRQDINNIHNIAGFHVVPGVVYQSIYGSKSDGGF